MKSPLFAMALLAAAAVPAYAGNSVCLYHRYVDGWTVRNKTSMVVNELGRKYLVNLQGDCSDLPFATRMGFTTPGNVPGPNCVDHGDSVVMRGGSVVPMPGICWVAKVQRYTPAMQAADKAAREKHRPLPAF